MGNIILRGEIQIAHAIQLIRAAEANSVVTIAKPRRTSAQNAKLWAMLEDVSRAQPEGRQWTRETWKAAFMHFLGHQVQFAMALDNSEPFPMGFRSSKLSVPQMCDLIECIYEYGARHGVEWRETRRSGHNPEEGK